MGRTLMIKSESADAALFESGEYPKLDAEQQLLATVDQLVDGSLDSARAEIVTARLEADPALATERRLLERLKAVLEAERIEVGPELADAVMARLGSARPSSRAWPVAVAVVAFLGILSAAVLRPTAASAAGPLSAVADFFASAALAGSGLLAASWRGMGQWVSGWLGASALNLLLGVGILAAVNLLLISLLRRRRAPAYGGTHSSSGRRSRD